MRRGGAGKRRDAIEPAIIEALRAAGCRVWQLHGRGLPDLLVWHTGYPTVLEVKSPGGRKTPAQQGTPWPVVRSVSEARKAVGLAYHV